MLETGNPSFSQYLDELITLYCSQKNDSFERQAINDKYRSFLNYIKSTWLPRYAEGMLNYAKTNRKEWTNNGLERYHQRLQQKLAKSQSMQLFFNEIQPEEKYF